MGEDNTRSPVALVTGGRRGIGSGIVLELAKAGFDLLVNDIVDDDLLAGVCEEARKLGRQVVPMVGDISDLEKLDEFVDRAWKSFGAVDCLVNNAAVPVDMGDMLNVSAATYERSLNNNARGPFFLTQSIAKRMMAQPDSGIYRSIVFISSGNAYMASPDRSEYCIAKAAISMMVKLYGTRLASEGIGVHEVRPGITLTGMSRTTPEKFAWLDGMVKSGTVVPLGRWGTPQDLGRGVAAIASGAFSFSTGGAFDIDGGLHIHRI